MSKKNFLGKFFVITLVTLFFIFIIAATASAQTTRKKGESCDWSSTNLQGNCEAGLICPAPQTISGPEGQQIQIPSICEAPPSAPSCKNQGEECDPVPDNCCKDKNLICTQTFIPGETNPLFTCETPTPIPTATPNPGSCTLKDGTTPELAPGGNKCNSGYEPHFKSISPPSEQTPPTYYCVCEPVGTPGAIRPDMPTKCLDKDDPNFREGTDTPCTSARGTQCGSENDPAIATAIGCIHTSPVGFIKDFLKFILGISGGLAFLMMLLGAFQMLTSAGNPETLAAGRDRLTSAIIGLLFVIFAVLLLQIIGVDILGIPGFKEN